jgi:hypothetical protein
MKSTKTKLKVQDFSVFYGDFVMVNNMLEK